jgi:uncharacterized protein YbjT (DUF2867 family)
MKIVIVGGTGFIGTKCVSRLRQLGHEVIAASPRNHVNTITKEGLHAALEGAAVVVDVSNPHSYEDTAVFNFFQSSGRNLMAAALSAGVRHHVVLSIVGADRMQNIGYMRGKIVQEEIVAASGIPYTIIRSTQFFELLSSLADQDEQGGSVYLSNPQFQPIAGDEAALFLTQYALSVPVNGIKNVAGPERSSIAEMIVRYLRYIHDTRTIVLTGKATYYGQPINGDALVPAGEAELGVMSLEKWLSGQVVTA